MCTDLSSQHIYLLYGADQLVGTDVLLAGVKVKNCVHLNSSGFRLCSILLLTLQTPRVLASTKGRRQHCFEVSDGLVALPSLSAWVLQVWSLAAVFVLPGISLEMQMLRLCAQPGESETALFNKPYKGICCTLRFENRVCVGTHAGVPSGCF